MYNNNIFKKICHDQSGQEFDLGYIEEGTFIETLSLDGPKLLLTMMDPYSYLRDGLKVKELDTLSVTLTDSFASDRLDANMTFTLLKMQSNGIPSKMLCNRFKKLHSKIHNRNSSLLHQRIETRHRKISHR